MNYIIFLITILVIVNFIGAITRRRFLSKITTLAIVLLIIFCVKDINNTTFYSRAKEVINNEILTDTIKDVNNNQLYSKIRKVVSNEMVTNNAKETIDDLIKNEEDIKAFNTYVVSKLSYNGAKFIREAFEKFKIEMDKEYENYRNSSKDNGKVIVLDVHEDDVEIFERNRFRIYHL